MSALDRKTSGAGPSDEGGAIEGGRPLVRLDDLRELGVRQRGDLSDQASTSRGAHEQRQALDIRIGVVALSAGGAHGRHGTVALLPRPEEIRREPGALRHDTHRMEHRGSVGVCHDLNI
jgi:hypothetical protein